jgi:hypothetical protein
LATVTCPDCGSSRIQERGFNASRTKKRIECQEPECGAWNTLPVELFHSFVKSNNAPRILIFDIETSLKRARLFRHGKQYVSASAFEDMDKMICWSAKWLGDNKVFGDVQTPEEAVNRDHDRITHSLWDAMSTANFYVTHNGINFDMPMVNTFFVEQRLGLPGFGRNIDTCAIARKNFAFESNAMDYLCKRLGLNDGKIKTSIELWDGCYEGNPASLDYMFEYNKMDVVVLEDLYNLFIPYVPNFPNLGIWGDVNEQKCPYCGGTDFKLQEGVFKYSPSGKFNSYRCSCQAIFRSKLNLLSTRTKKLQFVT